MDTIAPTHQTSGKEGVEASYVDNVGETTGDKDKIAQEAVGGRISDLPPGYYRSMHFIGTFLALSLASISAYLGWVLPANVLTIINEDLGPSPNYAWIAIVWSLANAITYILVGRLSDLFGRRWFMIVGNSLGLVGGIIAATATRVNQVIGANVLIGIASAVQLTFPTIISELVANKHRPYGVAALFVASLPVGAFGPVIARAFVQNTERGWRWCYYINIMTTAITITLFYFFYHPPTFALLHTKRSRRDMLKMLDVGGIVLFTGGLTVFLLGISWGGELYPWKSGRVIGTIIGGAAILALFAIYEMKVATEYPLLPLHLFKNRKIMGATMTESVGAMVYYSATLIWPIQISVLYETDTIMIGWLSCTIGSGAIIGQCLSGALIKRLGKQKWQLVFWTCFLTASVGSMAASNQSTRSLAIAFTFCSGLAIGYIANTAFVIAPFCVDDGDIGLALGLLGSARCACSAVAQSVFLTVMGNKITSNVPKYVVPAVEAAGLPSTSVIGLLQGLAGIGNLTNVPGLTPRILEVAVEANKTAYSKSFQVVYLAAIAFGALSIVAAFCAPNVDEFWTDNVSRRLHGRGLENKAVVVEKEAAV